MRMRMRLHCAAGPALGLVLAAAACAGPSKEDSGWASLWNGKDFSGFYVYAGGKGYTETKDQTMFKMADGMLKADGPYGLLTTVKEYSHYRMRVDYMFAAGLSDSANAGLIVLMDNAAAKTVKTTFRPRSIEINFIRYSPYPGTLWAGLEYGPYITTTVKAGTQKFLPKAQGGVEWTCEPWDASRRVVQSSLPLLENPPGQWNHVDVLMRGDSIAVGWNGQLRGSPDDSAPAHRVRVASGGVSIQSEGYPISYRGWEIQELDSATGIPLNARRGCTDRTAARFDARAVIDDGSCGNSAVRESKAAKGAGNGDGRRWGVPVYAEPDGVDLFDPAGRSMSEGGAIR
jgi:hypothetical protein